MISVAADLGGTMIKLGIVQDGRLVSNVCIPSESACGLDRKLPEIGDAIDKMLSGLGMEAADCDRLAVAFPGLVDSHSGRVTATYAKWDDAPRLDLKEWARNRFGLPLIIENDSRMALLGEWRCGAGVGCDNLVLITVGTGLGTAAVVEGHLLKGVHGQAGVLGGHVSGKLDGALCTCGNIGCAEAEASTYALPRAATEHPDFQASSLHGHQPIDYRAVIDCARLGDRCSQYLLARSIDVWAQMAVSLIHAYDPERMIWGGSVLAAASDFLPTLTASILSRAHTPWGKVEVRPSLLGASAALLGADVIARPGFSRPS